MEEEETREPHFSNNTSTLQPPKTKTYGEAYFTMVTVDSLNFDILELIFAYLSREGLVSVSLVNWRFLQGALPHLYHTLVYRIAHKKKYPKVRR